MDDTDSWKATCSLFGCISLNSIRTLNESDEKNDKFKLVFLCSQTGDNTRKTLNEMKRNKPIVLSIKYKNISICNITQTEVTLNTLKDKEYIILTTDRLKSIVEIGKLKANSKIPLYYIAFSSNYQEQLSVCKNAESMMI